MHEYAERLRFSKFFLCLVTPYSVQDPKCFEQIHCAKRLSKPCRALIQKGTHVPEALFEGFRSLERYSWGTVQELEDILDRTRPSGGFWYRINGGG